MGVGSLVRFWGTEEIDLVWETSIMSTSSSKRWFGGRSDLFNFCFFSSFRGERLPWLDSLSPVPPASDIFSSSSSSSSSWGLGVSFECLRALLLSFFRRRYRCFAFVFTCVVRQRGPPKICSKYLRCRCVCVHGETAKCGSRASIIIYSFTAYK